MCTVRTLPLPFPFPSPFLTQTNIHNNGYVYGKWAIDNSVIAMWWESIYQAYLFIWSAVTKYGMMRCELEKKVSECMSGSGGEVASNSGSCKWQIAPIKNSEEKKKKHIDKTYSFPFCSFDCNINKHVCIYICFASTTFMSMCSYT